MPSLQNLPRSLTIDQIAAQLKTCDDKVLVLMVGIPGSGKSTLARGIAQSTGFLYLSADAIRLELTGDENKHDQDELVWSTLTGRLDQALAAGVGVLIDNMNHTRRTREKFIEVARLAGYLVKLVILEVPLATCIERDKNRSRSVGQFFIMEKYMQFVRHGKPLPEDCALWLTQSATEGLYEISHRKTYKATTRLDIVGDVHGCLSELKKLLKVLGYELHNSGKFFKPHDRNLAFVGDLVDRGPDSIGVLEYAIELHKHGAIFVLGNHCHKLLRALEGENVKMGQSSEKTLEQIRARGQDFVHSVVAFLKQVPTIFQNDDLIIVHAAYKELARGEKAESLALYGETTGERDSNGFPVRLDKWETAYLGGKTIVHGHVPLHEPYLRHVSNGGCIVNVDTACCFGNKLTALRFPEMEFISTPALDAYSVFALPGVDFSQKKGAQKMLDYEGKNPIWTGAYGLGKGLPTLPRFAEMERDGWIWSKSLKTKDGFTYRLFNYGKPTTYERVWNEVTLASRGLIVCEETGECIAAAMGKFFNVGETITAGRVCAFKDGAFHALVKLDGACGTGYRLDGSVRWATRGSFNSVQAQAAEKIWREKYAQYDHLFFGQWSHLTPVVEIIHPSTKQVVKYDFTDLVLIACRDRFTGEDLLHDQLVAIGEQLGMPVVEKIESTDADALMKRVATLDGNQEGFVVFWPGAEPGNNRAKLKGDEYKKRHRLLSGITPAVLADAWYRGELASLIPLLEEEFREETETLAATLDANTIELAERVEAAYRLAPANQDQKAFATWVKSQPGNLAGMLFGRKQLDYPRSSGQYTRAALAQMINSDRLSSLLEACGEDQLRLELLRFNQALSQFLWDKSRSQGERGRLQAVAQHLPKVLRGTYSQVADDLFPHLIVEKMREFVRSSLLTEINCIDVDAVFAEAPPPTSAEQIHQTWVFSQDMRLRPFLDRWRQCGRRETANSGARRLLGEAVGCGVMGEFLQAISASIVGGDLGGTAAFDHTLMAQGLALELAKLAEIWGALPLAAGPSAVYTAAKAADANASVYATALLNEIWSSQRTQVRDSYLASDPEMAAFSRLEES